MFWALLNQCLVFPFRLYGSCWRWNTISSAGLTSLHSHARGCLAAYALCPWILRGSNGPVTMNSIHIAEGKLTLPNRILPIPVGNDHFPTSKKVIQAQEGKKQTNKQPSKIEMIKQQFAWQQKYFQMYEIESKTEPATNLTDKKGCIMDLVLLLMLIWVHFHCVVRMARRQMPTKGTKLSSLCWNAGWI